MLEKDNKKIEKTVIVGIVTQKQIMVFMYLLFVFVGIVIVCLYYYCLKKKTHRINVFTVCCGGCK